MSTLRIHNILEKFCHTAAIWLIFSSLGNAQLVELNLRFSQDTIPIGEQTILSLDISKHRKVVLQDFALKDSLNKEIEILDSLRSISADSLVLNLYVTSFTAGQYLIPSIPLVFSFENNLDTIFSPERLLTVISPQINSQAEIKDIKPPLNLPFRLREIIPQTGIVIGILTLILLLVFYLFRRLRKKNIFEKAERVLPPHVLALRDLDQLKAEKLWQKGYIKEYYSRLADIMRVYLEQRFNIPAMEFVSSETIHSFQKIMPQEDLLREMLKLTLETSDLVKFAKADPLPADNQGNMDNAYLFIGQTKIEEILIVDEKVSEIENENINDKIHKG